LEHAIVEGFWTMIGTLSPNVRESWDHWRNKSKEQAEDLVGEDTVREGEVVVRDHTLEAARKSARGETASTYSSTCPLAVYNLDTYVLLGLWTEILLAYGIHKTLVIWIRVPLAVAITPKIVKVLRARGWKIGRTKPKK